MLKPLSDLHRKLITIDGEQYPAYKEIRGEYETAKLQIIVDHVQNDPFTASTRLRILVDQKWAKFPEKYLESRENKLALRDFIARQLAYEIEKFSKTRGTGRSGEIHLPEPGQEILDRSSVLCVDDRTWEARIFVGLPASGKHVIGHIAAEILCNELPRIAEKCMFYENLNSRSVIKHMELYEDAQFIRSWLEKNKMVAFIAENAVLPRNLANDKPNNSASPFKCEDNLYTTLPLPNRGEIRGLAIPEGITFLTGPACSGKSTILSALQKGIFNHVPGDGRGYAIIRNDAIKINLEPDRSYASVNLSIFNVARNLSFPKKEKIPASLNHKISQMVNFVEALELDSKTLLFDENNVTPDFIYADSDIYEEKERSIVTLIPALKKSGVSAIFVGRGIPFIMEHADNAYLINSEHEISQIAVDKRETIESEVENIEIESRSPNPRTIIPKKGNKSVLIASRGTETFIFGTLDIDVSKMENLLEQGQLDAIGQSINYARRNLMGEKYALKNIASRIQADIINEGWDIIDNRKMGIYVEFRPIDFAMILNRITSLEILK